MSVAGVNYLQCRVIWSGKFLAEGTGSLGSTTDSAALRGLLKDGNPIAITKGS